MAQLRDLALFGQRTRRRAAACARFAAVGKAKRRAAQQARDTAAELLALYASRAARQGARLRVCKAHDYDAFADGFGFEETADQANAMQQ